MNFEQIFRETRVVADRHISFDEKEAVLDFIKSSIENQDIELLPRQKNYQFLSEQGLDERDVFNLLYTAKPKNLLAVIPDEHRKNEELYLFCLSVGNQPIYAKLTIDNGECKIVSFHDQTAHIFMDYSNASDFQDDGFVKQYAGRWRDSFNKKSKLMIAGKLVRIKSYFCRGKVIHFDFNIIPKFNKKLFDTLLETQPYAMGKKITQYPKEDGGGLEFTLQNP